MELLRGTILVASRGVPGAGGAGMWGTVRWPYSSVSDDDVIDDIIGIDDVGGGCCGIMEEAGDIKMALWDAIWGGCVVIGGGCCCCCCC